MNTFTVIVIIESEFGTAGFPAVKGLTHDQVESERARVRSELLPGATLTWKVIAEQ